MKKTLVSASIVLAMITSGLGPAAATQPVDPVPLLANLYEIDFEAYDGGSASGVGYLASPTSAKGPTLSVEVAGLAANTIYKVRFGGPEDDNSNPSRCSQSANQLAPFTADNSEFQDENGASVPTGEEGVLRWTYAEMAEFTGDRVVEVNNGEPVIVITTTGGTIVACGELGGVSQALPNPTSRTFPVARVGGATPQNINGSDITVSGQVNLTGSLLDYDFTLRGESLIDANGSLQNHIIMLRSTASCDGTTENALRQTVASFTNLKRSTARARSIDDLNDVFPRSHRSDGDSLQVRGSMILPGIDQNTIGNYGIVVLGLESGSTARPTGELQQREMTPSACLNLVDKASEVGPVALADAATISEIINADEYRTDTDPEILRLYGAFFRREPDVEGAKYWMSVSRGEQDGKTYSNLQIARFFTNSSSEFQSFYEDAPSNEAFLTRVYTNVLGRDFDAAGFAYWLDILNGTNASGENPTRLQGNRADVVFYVALSTEFVNAKPYLP